MVAGRVACLLVAAWLLAPTDVLAQGRGNGRLKNNGNGPAFCRSGAGHPVHGWAWCRERGWDRNGFWRQDDVRNRDERARRREDRDRDRRDRRRDDGGWWPF